MGYFEGQHYEFDDLLIFLTGSNIVSEDVVYFFYNEGAAGPVYFDETFTSSSSNILDSIIGKDPFGDWILNLQDTDSNNQGGELYEWCIEEMCWDYTNSDLLDIITPNGGGDPEYILLDQNKKIKYDGPCQYLLSTNNNNMCINQKLNNNNNQKNKDNLFSIISRHGRTGRRAANIVTIDRIIINLNNNKYRKIQL